MQPSDPHRIPCEPTATRGEAACVHHAGGTSLATARRRGPRGRDPRDRRGHRCHTPFQRCRTAASPWTRHGPSAGPPTSTSSPPPVCATRSSTSAPRCTGWPPRSTSCGRASAAAPPPPGARREASPASRSARGPARRAHTGAGRPQPQGVPPPAAPQRLGPRPRAAGVPPLPSGRRAASVGRVGRSPRAGRTDRALPLAGRAADQEGYPPRRG